MIKQLNDFRNLGIDSTLDRDIAKRIRLCNSMSIMGISTAFVVLFYGVLAKWPPSYLILSGVATIATFIPPFLNSIKKTISARISFLIISNGLTVIFSILFGPTLHFQYFLFALLGLPFILFGKEIGRKKFFYAIAGILSFISIEFYFYFLAITREHLPYLNVIRFINDILIGTMILVQYYFFVIENDQYNEDIEEKSIELEEINSQLGQYILDIKEKSNELEDKNTQLEHFAYITSHDLSEPIRTVKSFIEIIKEDYEFSKDKELKTYFNYIDSALIRMRKMIDGLLKYSKIGKSDSVEQIDLNYLLGEIKEDLGLLIKEKRATLNHNVLPTVYCIKLEIKQLFQNLISNGIKFQHPDSHPEINITWRDNKNHWEFCVTDNGIGISSNKLKDIFQMFKKLHVASKFKGHGIGLAFCKKIVELHNGKIWVASSVGNGSQFYFTIQKPVAGKTAK